MRMRGMDEDDRREYARQMEELTEKVQDLNTRFNPARPYDKVKVFHEKYGQPVGEEPRFLSPERQALREALIDEEVQEFKDAIAEGDLVNAFKELADIIYVVQGTAVEMGGDLDKVFTEVHLSNMSKLGEDGKPIYREDGKVLKGPNYHAPDVKTVLGL
jgi:predicted HAD superfamily Cof-like phosphohydrolase